MRWERIQRQVGLADSSSSGPGKRWGHTCNAIKGGRFVYVFGGFGSDGCLTNQVHLFDAETQIWSEPVIRGVPPSPRDSHSCTTVGDNLFVFGGTDGKHHLNDLHVLDTCTHTWKCLEARGEGPEAREGHSATLVGKHIFVFGGCGKISGSDDEVFYNDLYLLNTETITWQRAATNGKPPSARDGHTCSTWNNKIIVVGGEESEDLDDYYLSDVHILDTDKFVWKQLKTSGQLLTPRAGHVTVAIESNLFVFGGFTDSQNLYNDLYVLDLETRVWSKLIAMEEGPSGRFSAAAVCLGPYKAGSFLFIGGCNKNLEPLDDIYYLHTDGVYEARLAKTPGRLSLRKQMKLKCQEQKRVAVDQGKTVFQARVTESSPLGYTIETIIDGKVLRGVLLSNSHGSSGKRPAVSDADFDHRAKTQRTLSKDSAGGSQQQAGPVDPSKDQNPCQIEMDTVNKDPSAPVTLDQVNVEPLRNEMSTNDVGAAAEAGPGGELSPQKQDEGRVAAEDANAEQ
ncbi:uncharacterized protein LOC108841072 [Raphanus sativus]|uniref:Uncharacterized protein LOC108841072 n=1 Tax=Raphanus sativus TaxID=3726 RepID=A0A6J0MAE5_RAPSA|nr:uncharacterized protein LOC108841072 [Raphanus sativus]